MIHLKYVINGVPVNAGGESAGPWAAAHRFMSLSSGNSLKESASTAYDLVLAPHHPWAIRKAVGVGTNFLPSRSQFLSKLNEKGTI